MCVHMRANGITQESFYREKRGEEMSEMYFQVDSSLNYIFI